MEWLFFQSQPHRPAHVRREVFVAPSPHPRNKGTVRGGGKVDLKMYNLLPIHCNLPIPESAPPISSYTNHDESY